MFFNIFFSFFLIFIIKGGTTLKFEVFKRVLAHLKNIDFH